MKEFSDLVGRIYDAALTPEIWNDVLARVRTYVRTETAAINSYDAYDLSSWGWQYLSGYNPEYLQIYIQKYLAMNPWMVMEAALGSGEIGCASAQSNYQESLQSEFYHGWLAPQRFVDGAVLIVDKTIGAMTTLVTVRTDDQGLFDPESLERMTLLYPHLRRAAAIGRIVSAAQAQAEKVAVALDALSAAVFLLNGAGRIVHANKAGEKMLASKAPVQSVHGRLEFAAADRRTTVRALIEGAADPGASAPKAASSPLTGLEGQAFIAHALALDAARRDALSTHRDAAFIVLIKEANPATAASVAAVAKRYKLTPQEARVLRMVVDAGGVPLAADALNLSPTTVRTHIARIYDKTGARSQGALIKLLGEMDSPLRAAARTAD